MNANFLISEDKQISHMYFFIIESDDNKTDALLSEWVRRLVNLATTVLSSDHAVAHDIKSN